MSDTLNSTVRLFAGDTIACVTINSEIDPINLQSDLDKLAQWKERGGRLNSILTKDLSWNQHISSTASKGTRYFNFLKRNFRINSTENKLSV